MSTQQDTTNIWPQGTPPATQSLILKLFSILDDKSSNSGQRLADEVFTPDGVFNTGRGIFNGRDEISTSRQNAWTAWSTRKHSVVRAYSRRSDDDNNENNDDILLIGSLYATFPNGEGATGEFCARIEIAGGKDEKEEVRIKSYTVWADATPFVTAMSKKA